MPTVPLQVTITSKGSAYRVWFRCALSLRRLEGCIDRHEFPTWGFCYCCGRTYNQVDKHLTPFSEREGLSEGGYPLCEWCWSHLTVDERLPYYQQLIEDWRPIRDREAFWFSDDWEDDIIRAVRSGL